MPTPTIPLTTFELPSHCIVTVSAGTTYTLELHRAEVHTRVAIRFDGAYPLTIKGIRQGEELCGFDMTVTGADELTQLIRALETAATELRLQVDRQEAPPAPRTLEEAIAAGQVSPLDTRAQVVDKVQAKEISVIELLVIEGGNTLPEGSLVVDYLLARLRDEPFITSGCAELWRLTQQARATHEMPTLAWLRERADAEGCHILLHIEQEQERYNRLPLVWRMDSPPRDYQRTCDRIVAATQKAHVQLARTDLLAQLQQADEQSGLLLMERYQALGQREVELVNRLNAV